MLGTVPSELKPVYLLTGSDRPKIARALRRLRARIGEDAVEHLSAREASGAEAAAACNALGLFGGDGRLVIVDEVERWKAAEAKDLAGYLASPSPDTVLALEPIGVKEVEGLSAGRAETSIFALTDAWGRRDVAAVLAAAESRLERSDRPRSVELPRLVGLLVNHVGRVRACQALADEGVRPRDAAPRLKMHPFAAEKAFAQAQNFSAGELGAAIVRLAQLDHAIKGGSRPDDAAPSR